MRRGAAFLAGWIAVAGTLGPAALPSRARAAPDDGAMLPASILVLRAAADANGVFACIATGDGSRRALVQVEGGNGDGGGRSRALVEAARIEAMALDRERVYWVGADGVQAVRRAGGPVEALAGRDWTLLAGDSDASRWAVAVDAGEVYFSIDDAIGRVPAGGGAAERLDSAPGAMLVGVDADDVWWLEKVLEDDDSTSQDLWATPKRGGASRRALAGLTRVLTVAVDAAGVFLLRGAERPDRGEILRVDPRTGNLTQVHAEIPVYSPHALAASGGSIAWLEYPDGLHGPTRLRAMAERGGEPTTLASFFPPASRLAIGGARVYAFGEGLRAFDGRGTSAASADVWKVEVPR